MKYTLDDFARLIDQVHYNAKPKNQIWIWAYLSCLTKKINRH